MTIGNVYECTTQFELPKWDGEEDEYTDEILMVEKDSVWNLTKRFKGNNETMFKLENDDDCTWIEIGKNILNKYFKDITKDNNEMGTDEYLRSGY